MAWTAPRTWTTGELVTAALLNTHVRDNLLESAAAKVTTAGDLVYATGANALARLPKGTAAQVLKMNPGATAPEWGAPTLAASSTIATSLAIGTNPATAGLLRLANADGISFRNGGNTNNVQIVAVDASNNILFGDANQSLDTYFYYKGSRNLFFIDGTLTRMLLGAGLVLGSATGGDKGAGTINVQNDIYKNNTAYTNPDYAFEHAFTGKIERFADRDGAASYEGLMPLVRVEAYAREHLHLPRVSRDPMGMFARGDVLLEKIEEMYLYLFEINRQLKAAGMAGV